MKMIEKETFKNEIRQCRKLYRENGGKCAWGNCANCGVIPLLYKLGKGVLLEDKTQIEEVKKNIFETDL